MYTGTSVYITQYSNLLSLLKSNELVPFQDQCHMDPQINLFCFHFKYDILSVTNMRCLSFWPKTSITIQIRLQTSEEH